MSTESIIALSQELSRLLRKAMASKDSSCGGANLLQLHGLTFIGDTPGITMKELAVTLKIGLSTATTFVDRLEKSGWVTRRPDLHNRKIVRLHITSAGDTLLRNAQTDRSTLLHTIYSSISADDQSHLERILSQLVASFQSTLPSPRRHL